MRSFALLLTATLAFAAGCGGRTSAVLGGFDGGTSSGASSGSSGASSSGASSSGASSSGASSSGASSSGASSSGASSGSSSGGSSGSSSGGSSGSSSGGSSGSSSGGPSCEPLPGCNSSFECPSPDSCGLCFCEDGDWICDPGDSVDSGAQCPSAPPFSGEPCSGCQAYGCGYASDAGCGETCTCQGGTWECFTPPCTPPPPPPICPEFPPSSGTACFGVGSSCFYDTDDGGLCQDAIECVCDPSGTFDCFPGCIIDDSGPPDTGPPFDAGPPDSGPCPESVPFGNSPCPDDGLVCSYFAGCETNCLCAQNSWVCATQGGPCAMPGN